MMSVAIPTQQFHMSEPFASLGEETNKLLSGKAYELTERKCGFETVDEI